MVNKARSDPYEMTASIQSRRFETSKFLPGVTGQILPVSGMRIAVIELDSHITPGIAFSDWLYKVNILIPLY
jgi:hypothetical protein